MKIGILALQGNVREHINILKKLEVQPIKVKAKKDLEDLDALIIPGGESTTIGILVKKCKLDKAIKEKYKLGMPIYGTCAGAILVSDNINKSKQARLDLADISIERNAYGRQLESFEADLEIEEIGKLKGIFIRAPVITSYNGAKVMAKHNSKPVMLKHNNLLITTFHPELANDTRIHKYFLNMATEYKKIRDMQRDIEEIK